MIGVDEVGRGCLAGPLLVVAARATSELPIGLKDSKLMSRKQREKILDLLSICCEFGEGWVSAAEIDRYGLGKSLRFGVARALKNLLALKTDEIIMDGKVNYIPKKFKNSRCLVGADNLVPIVSAASIYAKVERDAFMRSLASKHPLYRFEYHVGYGTKARKLALQEYGFIKSVHRISFNPIKEMVL
jgi:ribonuclease HII